MANFTLQGTVRDSTGNTTTAPVNVTVTAGGMPTFGHVFVVVEENRNYTQVVGNMPYLEGLAAKYGLATQYYADTHPSIGNYFMMLCGQIITNDDNFSTIVTVDNIVRRLVAAGKTWKAYAESLPSVGYLGPDTGQYARKHNPIVLFSDVANNPTQAQNVVPFTQFATDLAAGTLPNYSFIAPNLINDAHDGTLTQADTWLRTNIDPLIQSPVFQQDGVLFVIFDESASDNTNGGGKVYAAVISVKAISNTISTTLHNHEAMLRTCQEALGLTPLLGSAASVADMSEFFVGAAPPPPPPPPPTNWVFDHFVATTGRAGGPGTITDPWSLAYVAAGAGGTLAADVARAAPNNHSYVAVRGGTYHITSQLNFTVNGTLGTGVDALDGKIIVRNYPGEQWVITAGDGANHSFDCVRNVGNYCWIWGFELFWSTWGVRTAAPAHVTGCYLSQQTAGGSKFIHCITHDLDNGMTAEYWTAPTIDNEYYGCIGYNNGLNNSSPGGNGHAIYVRHDTTNNAYLNIRACIAFDQFGLNYQVYDQSAGLNHLRVEDCIGFNGGMRSSSSTGGQELVCWTPNAAPHEISLKRNLFFKHSTDPGPMLSNIGKSGDVGANIEIADNYCVSKNSGQVLQIQATINPQTSASVHGNFGRTAGTVVSIAETGTAAYDWRTNEWHRNPTGGFSPGGSFASFTSTTGLSATDTCVSTDPTTTKVFVVPANKYEPGRAHICYYDWANLAGSLGYIPADVSSILTINKNYLLYDVRDLVNPVQVGIWDGTPLKLPITQLPPQPAGGTSTGPTPPQTAPFFNVFVLRTL